MKNLIFSLSFFLVSTITFGQEITQTVRGVVKDQDSQTTIPGASVVVLDQPNFKGSVSDIDGKFRIENVPVGRVTIKISYVGYEDKLIPNVIVSSAKEVILDIQLQESLAQLEEIVVNGKKHKSELNNEMAVLSARTFSVEETKRYAGSLNDPARMVSGFAGVAQDAEGNNDIIVRGNSSRGILWRLEGVEIPNPNHFADEGSTGGPINALNSAMLANSDFYSGAFAPEYGNAFSGVFDMKLRTGNNEKREYAFTAGVLGMEATLEGPFSKNGNGSYLVNYRYSSLAILDELNIVDFDGVPKYQDASFKFHMPTKKAGSFSLFGLGGMSTISQQEEDEDDPNKITGKADYDAYLGVVGLNHVLPINKNTYLKNSVSFSKNGSGGNYLELTDDNTFQLQYDDLLDKSVIRTASTLNTKVNAKHKVQLGAIHSQYLYNFSTNYYNEERDQMIDELREKGNAGQMQGFATWKYRINKALTMVSGLHYNHLLLNGANSIEPRAAMKWQFTPKQSLNAGFGVHSKIEPLTAYFALRTSDNGVQYAPNKNLRFGKANHYVIGYENLLTNNLLFKVEAYYQQLYNLPIENDATSHFALLNTSGWFTDRVLRNDGKGSNYGIEFTLERYFANRYFFMVTASLFESTFVAGDGKRYDTRFNGNYVGNVLFGKEFQIGAASKNKVLGVSGKASLLGAKPYTPINLEASISAGEGVRDNNNPFSTKADDIFQANFALYYRRDRKKTTHEFKLDIQNVSNNQARLYDYYNSSKEKIEYGTQLSLIPSLYYTIEF